MIIVSRHTRWRGIDACIHSQGAEVFDEEERAKRDFGTVFFVPCPYFSIVR